MKTIIVMLLMAVTTVYSQVVDYCNMNPNNWIRPNSGAIPSFYVTADTCYKNDGKVKVYLFSNILEPFTGFVIKAHTSDGIIRGMWEMKDPFRITNCQNGYLNVAVMEEKLGMNMTYAELTWTAPSSIRGNITFNATFIDMNGNQLMNITSDPVVYNDSCGAVFGKPMMQDVCKLVPANMINMDKSAMMNYGIELSQKCYKRSDIITVSLYSNIITPFYGFAIQGQDMMKRMPFGRFLTPENSNIKKSDCYGGMANTLSMPYMTDMMSTVAEMKWTPQAETDLRHVVFNATVIDENGYNLMNITSRTLKYDFYCEDSVIPTGKPPIAGAPKTVTSLFFVLIIAAASLL